MDFGNEQGPSTVVYRAGNARASIRDLIDQGIAEEGGINETGSTGSSPTSKAVSPPPGESGGGNDTTKDAALTAKEVIANKLDWKQGVFIPCLLNIWGVIMFLRLGWVVGQAGILLASLILVMAKVVTTITSLSLCAICTNGEVKGGGVYFLISRALGPIYGGTIGVLFFIAQAIATSMYVIGFAESVSFLLEINNVPYITGDPQWDITVLGLITSVLLLAVALIGVGWYAKCQVGLLVTLVISMISVTIGAFFPAVPDAYENAQAGFTGFTMRNLYSNFTADPATPNLQQNFFTVFAVFFPAATGVMAGANLSGDLKDPSHAIPKGTLMAVMVTFLSYLGLIWLLGTSSERCADRAGEDYCASYSTAAQTELVPFGGLLFNKLIMQNISIWAPLLYLGVFAATLSSALASLVGAPRILQSVASDKLFPWPWFNYFGKGRGVNNEPVRAYILTFLVCCACCVIGKLDVIAPLISNFFMISYAVTNYACFASSWAKYPGWRPSFKYYNKWLSLLGFFICLIVMFMMDWVASIVTIVLAIMLYIYLLMLDPDVNWGAAGEARKYVATLSAIDALQNTNSHVKTFRPQYLVLSGPPKSRRKASGLIKFVSLLSKGGGVVICGDIILKQEVDSKQMATSLGMTREQRGGSVDSNSEKGPRSPSNSSENETSAMGTIIEEEHEQHHELASCLAARLATVVQRREEGEAFLSDTSIWGGKRLRGAFFEAVIGEDLLDGFQSLLQTSGLGRLRPNTVVLGFKSNWQERSAASIKEFEQMIRITMSSDMGIMIIRDDQNAFDFDRMTLSRNVMSMKGGQKVKHEESDDIHVNQATDGASSFAGTNEHDLELSLTNPSSSVTGTTPTEGKTQRPRLGRQLSVAGKTLDGDTIDVWWIIDDGGLTMLIPHVLSCHRLLRKKQRLRVFTITNYNVQESSKLAKTEFRMVHLLKKFRIDATVVAVEADLSEPAKTTTRAEFEALGRTMESLTTTEQATTNTVLRLVELLREHTTQSTSLAFITLPIPETGLPVGIYTSWLHMLSNKMPPTVMMRGNNRDVMTFLS